MKRSNFHVFFCTNVADITRITVQKPVICFVFRHLSLHGNIHLHLNCELCVDHFFKENTLTNHQHVNFFLFIRTRFTFFHYIWQAKMGWIRATSDKEFEFNWCSFTVIIRRLSTWQDQIDDRFRNLRCRSNTDTKTLRWWSRRSGKAQQL